MFFKMDNIMAGLAVLLKIKRPIKVAHYITYRCNLRCDMCGRKDIPSQNELDTNACKQLQKDFKDKGTLVWSYSGGECLLRDDIVELSAHAKKLGLKLIVVTNGLLLSKRAGILEYVDVLNLSVDGNRDSHDKLRGVGNYDKVIKVLEMLKTNRRKSMKLVVNTILNNETIEHLDHMLDLAKQYNCELGFNPAIIHKSDVRDQEHNAAKYLPTNEQYNRFVQWLAEKQKGDAAKYLFDEISFFRHVGHYPENPTPIPCYGGFFQCSLDPFGIAFPCSDFFDFPEEYKKQDLKYEYGYGGFKKLPTKIPCGYQFCCTAKKNYFFNNPFLILKHFAFRK